MKNTYGKNIFTQFRKEHDITMCELSAMLKIKHSELMLIEKDKRIPSEEIYRRLEKIMLNFSSK